MERGMVSSRRCGVLAVDKPETKARGRGSTDDEGAKKKRDGMNTFSRRVVDRYRLLTVLKKAQYQSQ